VPSLAEVLRQHWPQYERQFGSAILSSHRRAVRAILQCRTAALGGEVYRCLHCHKDHFVYHSCNHRACPQCGHADATEWIERQKLKLLPVMYYLITFTVPEGLRGWLRSHQKIGYSLLLSPLFGFCAAGLLLLALKLVARQPELYRAPVGNQPPLLAVAVRFFFRREVETMASALWPEQKPVFRKEALDLACVIPLLPVATSSAGATKLAITALDKPVDVLLSWFRKRRVRLLLRSKRRWLASADLQRKLTSIFGIPLTVVKNGVRELREQRGA